MYVQRSLSWIFTSRWLFLIRVINIIKDLILYIKSAFENVPFTGDIRGLKYAVVR